MPDGVAFFVVSSPRADSLGRVALLAAEKGWEVLVFYTKGSENSGFVFELRTNFRRG